MDPREKLIWQAAEDLLVELGKLPTVDDVRARAKVAMGEASRVMRDFRVHHRNQVQAISAPLPVVLCDMVALFGARVWEEAMTLANHSLVAAKTGFDSEKEQSRIDSDELAANWDKLSAEHSELQAAFSARDAKIVELKALYDDADIRMRLTLARESLQQSRYEDVVTRCSELGSELIAERQISSQAREKTAELAGQLEIYRAQLVELKSEIRAHQQRAFGGAQ